jgi:hypothetical protein
MTRADVSSLCLALWRFERVRLGWENIYPKNVGMLFKFLPADQRAIFDQYIEEFKAAIDDLQLNPTEDRLKKIALRCTWENTSVAEMCAELTSLSEATIDELRRHVFVHVPAQKLEFADKPDQLFGVSWTAYPSAQENMASACRCYALGEDTASVFYSMGVLQKGLEALAKHLNVSFPAPLEAQQWQTIIDKLDAEIAQRTKMAAQQTQSSAKDEELKFYANTSLQFRYFKDAWRNDTAHFRRTYDSDEARTVLTHVKNFMVALSQKVKETL